MYTKDFSQLSKDDTLSAGGKGASLGAMILANFPVPPGFVVLTNAFNEFLKSNKLDEQINRILESVDVGRVESVESASKAIRSLILKGKIDKSIKHDIDQASKELNAPLVAVRSSATSEDSADAAWAGQLESFLNVPKEQVISKVRHCWSSLFTPRAIFYRIEKGIAKGKISVAVVIQEMVESETSGIAFSVHPITKSANHILIEAVYGLGEAIVSGQVHPDKYVVDKRTDVIEEVSVAMQERQLALSSGENQWRAIEKQKQGEQKLTGEQIVSLATVVTDIESYYGFPCDIEWAIENEDIYIVQSRPITTLT